MNFHTKKASKISLILLVILTMTFVAFAQTDTEPVKATIVYNDNNPNLAVALGNNLYCAGYVQTGSLNTKVEIVGGEQESDKHVFAEGDLIYISSGASSGVNVGDMFSVIRPRGKVNTKWTKKKNIGHYVQEVGAVQVMRVMRDVSVAKVTTSCGIMLFGDLLTRVPNRVSPMFKKRAGLDRFAESSGKANGRIFMARDGLEMLGSEQIVYVDLGRDNNVSVGDYMTVYRPLGTGNINKKVIKESIDNKEEGNASDRYEGGNFSNQSARKKGETANGDVVTTEGVKKRRPKNLRRVVGELIVLNVLERTATAMIVRNATEIHTGDQVELQ